jgi:hypothetical protein
MENEELQTEVKRLLTRGFIFGIIWIMGVGSVIAIISGFQAKKIISGSGNKLEGNKKATQSILIGIAGLLVWIIAGYIIFKYRRV